MFKKRNAAEIVNPGLPVVVVGCNEKVISFLEHDSTFHPVAIADYNMRGKTFHGLPVMESVDAALDASQMINVVLADLKISGRDLEKLRKTCERKGVGLHEYTWSRNSVSLVNLTGIVQEPYRVKYKGE